MDEIVLENERIANRWAYIIMILAIGTGIVCQIIYYNAYTRNEHILFTLVELFDVIGVVIAFVIPKNKFFLKKYVIIILLLITICMYCMLNASAVFLLYLIPLVISCRYYDKKILYMTGILTVLLSVVMWYGMAVIGVTMDMNLTQLEPNAKIILQADSEGWFDVSVINYLDMMSRIKNNMLVALPEELVFILFYFVAFMGVCQSGTRMMERREKLMRDKAYLERDLKMASNIQLSMLPDNFKDYGGEKQADIYAMMHAAENVGGDFYDFYMVDESHVCIVIGDVSGKGMPAALFMVKAQNTIKNYAKMGLKPNEIIQKTNVFLNESNKDMMFVTVWLGILNITSGELEYCVGGHNSPLLLKENGCYEYMSGEVNCIVGAIPDMEYEMAKVHLKKGDKLFLYTDGVTEGRDVNENQYGEQRLKDFLNQNKVLHPEKLIGEVRKELKNFSDGCEQFDDITMLCMEYIA